MGVNVLSTVEKNAVSAILKGLGFLFNMVMLSQAKQVLGEEMGQPRKIVAPEV